MRDREGFIAIMGGAAGTKCVVVAAHLPLKNRAAPGSAEPLSGKAGLGQDLCLEVLNRSDLQLDFCHLFWGGNGISSNQRRPEHTAKPASLVGRPPAEPGVRTSPTHTCVHSAFTYVYTCTHTAHTRTHKCTRPKPHLLPEGDAQPCLTEPTPPLPLPPSRLGQPADLRPGGQLRSLQASAP